MTNDVPLNKDLPDVFTETQIVDYICEKCDKKLSDISQNFTDRSQLELIWHFLFLVHSDCNGNFIPVFEVVDDVKH